MRFSTREAGHRPMGGQGGASRTAVLVCQGRAVAHGRLAPGRFDDPTALTLLSPFERVAVEQARAGLAPAGWGPRIEFEMVRACGEVMVSRTIAIDDAVRERVRPDAGRRRTAQLVLLGAGLDGRAWRMPELAGVTVFEVDHPASQRDKLYRSGELGAPVTTQHFVPVDFSRDDLDAALTDAGHRPDEPTVWVWEGVVPYLTRAEVTATVRTLAGRSAPASRLILHYHDPSVSAVLGRLAARALTAVSRRQNPMSGEPNRSSWKPAAMRRLLAAEGYRVVRDDDLLTLTERLAMPVRHRRSLRNGRILVADRD